MRFSTPILEQSAALSLLLSANTKQEKAKAGISHDDWFPRRPGVTFPIESEEARASCGTPNGSGVLLLLAQHKAGLGHKTVDKVTLLYREGNGMGLNEVPTLVFYIKDVVVSADMERIKKVIESGSLRM
jgi:hypothetical protein